MERSTDVLLVGGGVAAVRCARTLRREGFTGAILLVADEPVPPYNRPPLSKELLREELPDDLVLAESRSWYERRGVELVTGTAVVELDLDGRRATLDDRTVAAFDRCLLAPGAEPLPLPVPGAEHALSLRTLADARRLRAAAVAAGPGAPAVVIGGGFIGVEVASSLATLGLRPTIVERGGALWGGALGDELSRWGREALEGRGLSLRLGASATRIDPSGVWIGTDRLESALTVVGVGVRPRVDLAERAGLVVDDGIVTDGQGRTGHPAAWAAGDVARWADRRVEHWHAARESGERAGRSMLGAETALPPVPWVFSEVAGTAMDVVGAAVDWDEERWLVPYRLLALLSAGRAVQLASIGSAAAADDLRGLVARGATPEQIATSLAIG